MSLIELRSAHYFMAVTKTATIKQRFDITPWGGLIRGEKMKSEPIYENNELYTAFPDPDEVFYSEVEKERFLPLGTFHLQTDEGQHDVLIAAPIGDDEAMIGKENYGEFCGETWLTYLKVDEKWRLDCSPDQLLDFEIAFDEAYQIYSDFKRVFKLNGFLPVSMRGVKEYSKDVRKISLFYHQEYACYGYNWLGGVAKCFDYKLKDIDGVSKSTHAEDREVLIYDDKNNKYEYLGYVVTRALYQKMFYFYCPNTERVLVINEFD
ncbi:hypothetical protein [Marinibactrum halimedae]|uniref:Uncharacterized protein n=1 Tax=Marinibactrum halimedae TaxID=1444977 RepID=A0AA37T0X5_9GAMM|nr:hypothetical protein [Marinibactrum halimedae]MCD9457696.1 hypothetical protein [Marinibactrum halimedae]GLS24930.1 hypothetical protein GCM10007877_06440 [Marinibactrum halimedae]